MPNSVLACDKKPVTLMLSHAQTIYGSEAKGDYLFIQNNDTYV